MIETYAFFAMFLMQILVMSVLYPVRFGRLIRTGFKSVPPERLAELYPKVDVARAHERFLGRYRLMNTLVVTLGLAILGWFVIEMTNDRWAEGRVGAVMTAYFFLQNLPVLLLAWFTVRFNRVHRRSVPKGRRTAVFKRRGLFDFVSPFVILLVALSYASFCAFMFYVARHPFPGFGGPLANIGIVTLCYLFFGVILFLLLYGKKMDPLQTHASRLQMISMAANFLAWMAIITPIIVSLTVARQVLRLEAWGPFMGSVVFLVIGLLSLRALPTPPGPGQATGGTP